MKSVNTEQHNERGRLMNLKRMCEITRHLKGFIFQRRSKLTLYYLLYLQRWPILCRVVMVLL